MSIRNKNMETFVQHFNVSDSNKNIYGEVNTDFTLINKILDLLPKKLFKDKNLKWLDPASGIGNFPIAIYMKLMDGLKNVINDIERRKKHILENMLYMVEINEQNCNMIKIIFCENTYKLNLFEGSF